MSLKIFYCIMSNIIKILRFGLFPVLLSFFVPIVILNIMQLLLDIGSDGIVSTEESILITFIQFTSMIITVSIILVKNKRIYKKIYTPSFSLKSIVIPVVVGLVVLFATQVSISILSQLIGYETAENAVVNDENRLLNLALIPIMLLLVAPVEEILFRGILQGSIRDIYNRNIAILVSGILFGFVHIVSIVSVSTASALISIAGLSILGIVLGYIYERYQNILVPIMIHGIYNSIIVTIPLLV